MLRTYVANAVRAAALPPHPRVYGRPCRVGFRSATLRRPGSDHSSRTALPSARIFSPVRRESLGSADGVVSGLTGLGRSAIARDRYHPRLRAEVGELQR